MSLNWNLKAIAPEFKEVVKSDDRRGWPITSFLIMSLGALGVGSITKKNWREVYARLQVIDKLDDGSFEDYRITPEDIYRRIGLETNWMFTDKTRRSWMFNVVSQRMDAEVYATKKEFPDV